MLLHRSRSQGMNGPEPIKVSETLALARHTTYDTRHFVSVIHYLDDVFMNFVRQQQESNKSPDQGGRKGG